MKSGAASISTLNVSLPDLTSGEQKKFEVLLFSKRVVAMVTIWKVISETIEGKIFLATGL